MITLATCTALVGLVVYFWAVWHSDLPSLAIRYVCVAPFMPLVSLFNHNIDGDVYGTVVRTLPIYAATCCLGLALVEAAKRGTKLRLGFEGICLAVYALLTLLQIPFSQNASWAIVAWTFTVPGCLMFLLAGRHVTIAHLERDYRLLGGAAIGFVAINLALVAFGLFTGKATELIQTRNFGSVWSGNSLLMFLMLFGGLAWTGIRRSVPLIYAFLAFALLGAVISLSRTALVILAALIAFLTSLSRNRRIHVWIAAGIAVASLVTMFFVLRDRFSLDEQLLGGWLTRFYEGDVVGSIDRAHQLRIDEFQEYRDAVWRANPLFGTGIGTFRDYSIYTDAHNFLLTEAFENSVLAAAVLFFALGIPRALAACMNRRYRAIGVSVVGFLVIGQASAGDLSYRTYDAYYAVYPGWTLFLLVGMLIAAVPFGARNAPPVLGELQAHADPA